MKRYYKYTIASLLLGLLGTGILTAQESINKEIVVVKPYQPSLSDAFKINVLPGISDSISIHPSFDYTIEPRKYETGFQVQPIKPASLVGAPLSKLYKSHLKLGFGNYLMPLAELHINSLRSKESNWGLALKHYSINGKVKLDDGNKVAPGLFENSANIYGRKIFRNSYLSGNIRAAYDGGNFYGTMDTLPAKDDILQNYIKLDAAMQMGSSHNDSIHLNYTGNLDYQYTLDNYLHGEHGVILRADFNKLFKSGATYGLDITGAYFYTTESIDSSNNTVVEIAPWFGKTTPEYSYSLGVKLASDINGDDFKPYFFPEASLQINVVRGILIPYFTVGGGVEVNNLRSVISENRYITPGLKVLNTKQKISGGVGLKGSYTPKLSYDLGFTYGIYNDMVFYVNDTNSFLGNTFDVSYDDGELLTLFTEFQYHESEKLHIVLKGSYLQYKLESLEHPWHKPSLNFSLNGRYNLKDKILFDAGLIYVGNRYAQGHPSGEDAVSLEGFVDLNLGLEYRYTKILSGFVRINNILGSGNDLFYRYPRIGFNIMAGFTYAL
jgi:hypothetical protein